MSERALSFGANAELYDRARPSYPAELVDALLAEPAESVLDVGCGTGKAGRLFGARGCSVLGVEPDAAMAAVARRHGLAVDVASFEEWDPAGRRFDLAICAQAWHWIDHPRAVPKLAEALPPGGRFAAFWNFGTPVGPTAAALDEVYARLVPDLIRAIGTYARGAYGETPLGALDALVESGSFGDVEDIVHEWRCTYGTAEWLDQLRTYSDHALLPDERREELLGAVEETITADGGALQIAYRTAAVVARRR